MNRSCLLLLLFVVVQSNISVAADISSREPEGATLTVGVVLEDNFPLVYFDATSQAQGFEVAMVRHLARSGGYESCEIRTFQDKDALRLALENHQIDFGFSKLKKNEADAERFIFSQEYLTLQYVFLLHRAMIAKNDFQVEPLKKLAQGNLAVGTLNDPVYVEQLRRNYPGMQIKVFTSKKEVFDAVTAGEIAACYMDELEVKRFFLTSPAAALHLKYLRGKTITDAVALVFPWDNLFFREWVNIFLTKEGYTSTKLSDIMERSAQSEQLIEK